MTSSEGGGLRVYAALLRRPRVARFLLGGVIVQFPYGMVNMALLIGARDGYGSYSSAGFAHFFMDSRGQGGTWGNGGATSDPHGGGSADQGFMTRGIESPQDHYYRRLYVDAHHAVEVAAALLQVDESRIFVTGASQGEALTIAAASLNHRVVGAMPDVPFMSHFRSCVGMAQATPYEELVRYLAVFRDRVDTVFTTLSYFDAVLLGRRAAVPALFSMALLDTTCPPSSVFAARNWWGARSGEEAPPRPRIEVYPFNTHEGGAAYQWLHQVEWAKRLLDAQGRAEQDPEASE